MKVAEKAPGMGQRVVGGIAVLLIAQAVHDGIRFSARWSYGKFKGWRLRRAETKSKKNEGVTSED